MARQWRNRLVWAGMLLMFGMTSVSAEETSYKIDPDHTHTYFEYMHWGLSLQRGRFDRHSGSIGLDEDARSGSIDLVIDAASVSTGSPEFDQLLVSDTYFDAKTYPSIHFKSNALKFDGDKLIAATGELSIKDVTRTVTLDISHFACRFMLLYVKKACGANGSVKILRSDYGLGRYAPFVSDEATLDFSVEAIKQ